MSGFQSFLLFLHHFVVAKLVTSSIRVKRMYVSLGLYIYIYIGRLKSGFKEYGFWWICFKPTF